MMGPATKRQEIGSKIPSRIEGPCTGAKDKNVHVMTL